MSEESLPVFSFYTYIFLCLTPSFLFGKLLGRGVRLGTAAAILSHWGDTLRMAEWKNRKSLWVLDDICELLNKFWDPLPSDTCPVHNICPYVLSHCQLVFLLLVANCTLISIGDLKFWNNCSVAWKRETKYSVEGSAEKEDLGTAYKDLHNWVPPTSYYSHLLNRPSHTGLLLLLKHARHAPTSRSLYLLFPLPGMLSLQMTACLPLTSSRSLLRSHLLGGILSGCSL